MFKIFVGLIIAILLLKICIDFINWLVKDSSSNSILGANKKNREDVKDERAKYNPPPQNTNSTQTKEWI